VSGEVANLGQISVNDGSISSDNHLCGNSSKFSLIVIFSLFYQVVIATFLYLY